MGVPTYMYRTQDGEQQARVFDSDEIPAGWVDAPGKAERDIVGMDKRELEDLAREYGVELDRRRAQPALVAEVEALIHGDAAGRN